MMKFVISLAVAAVMPIYGAEGRSRRTGAAKATACHPEWNKGAPAASRGHPATRGIVFSRHNGRVSSGVEQGSGLRRPRGERCEESKAVAASSAQPVRVANSE